mgnify:CR=1 FL=1
MPAECEFQIERHRDGAIEMVVDPVAVEEPLEIRLSHADLRPEEVRWCRSWTVVWCVFFALNATTAAALAAYAPLTLLPEQDLQILGVVRSVIRTL